MEEKELSLLFLWSHRKELVQFSLQKVNARPCFLDVDFYSKNSLCITRATTGEWFFSLPEFSHYSHIVSIDTFCITKTSTSGISSLRIYNLIICLGYFMSIKLHPGRLFNQFGKSFCCLDLRPLYPSPYKKKNSIMKKKHKIPRKCLPFGYEKPLGTLLIFAW